MNKFTSICCCNNVISNIITGKQNRHNYSNRDDHLGFEISCILDHLLQLQINIHTCKNNNLVNNFQCLDPFQRPSKLFNTVILHHVDNLPH